MTRENIPEPDYSKAGFGKSQREEGCAECGKKASEGWALYCVKCTEREWVGLTDEEIKEIIGPWGDQPVKGYTRKLFDQIEAKLKEKNA